MKAWETQLKKGIAELCVLAALGRDEAYGYEILKRLAAAENLAFSESTVYPLLARLTREGAVSVRSADSPTGPTRRYYRLTAEGVARLETMKEHWKQLSLQLDRILDEAKGE